MRRIPSTPDVSALIDLKQGLRCLWQAYETARQAGEPVWNFAVEIDALYTAGLNDTALRFLACERYIEHASETTRGAAQHRTFKPTGRLTFRARTCVILTEAGVEFAKRFAAARTAPPVRSKVAAADKPSAKNRSVKPVWIPRLRELRLGSRVIKRFSQPASSQELILNAFQEDGSPVAIDDPLPPTARRDPKKRLRRTVQNLKRAQASPGIHFSPHANATGIRWSIRKRATS